MNINLKQLEAFKALVDCQNFTKASETLFLTQSTISSHISALEKEAGVKLAERTYRRKIQITPEGEKVYQYAVKILKLCREMEQEFEPEDCALSVAASTIPSQYLLPKRMAGFLKENVNIRFTLEKGDSAAVAKLLEEKKVRLGFLGTREENDSLEYQIYCKDYIVFVTPNQERYRKLKEQNRLGKDMLDEPMILRTQVSGTMKEFERYLKQQGIDEKNLMVVARINDPETIKSAVVNGMGVTVMSNLAVQEEAAEGRLLKFDLEENRFCRYIYAAYLKETRLTALEKRFIMESGDKGSI